MKYRFLLSAVAVAALALSACSGDGPAASIQTSEQPSTNQASKKPSGAEATVTIGDHVYEFSSDPALTWGKVMPAPCMEALSNLQISLWLVAFDGRAAEELDGELSLSVSDPVSASTNEVSINIRPAGLEYVAGTALNIVDVQDLPITLTRDGYAISGSQDVYNRVYDAPEPRVVAAQIDARCVDF